MKFFLAEVAADDLANSDRKAEQLASRAGEQIIRLGGQLEVGMSGGDAPAMLLVKLPDDSTVTPGELDGIVGEVTFTEVHALLLPQVPDHGIR